MSIEIIISLLAALGVGGVIGALVNRYIEQQKRTDEHDMRIFSKSSEIVAEQRLVSIINYQLLGNHSIRDRDFSVLAEWCRFFEQTGNQYIDRKIEKENKKLLNDLSRLMNFVGLNFFTLTGQSENNNNQYLQPDLCPDRTLDSTEEKTKKYDKYVSELEALSNKVIKQYSEYRLTIKKRLKM
jgi:hypothetical protein